MQCRLKSYGLGFLAFACAAGCGSPSLSSEPTVASSSAIQGGTNDTTHTFAVAVVDQSGAGTALCSGALLASNLVATARHCVAQISSTAINCATSTFGAVRAASTVSVVTDASLVRDSTHYAVNSIVVPSGANQNLVCGNDLALLILSQSIALPQYVTPVISPPMTDHRTYTTSVTAIGYGVTSAFDTTGATSGVRRIKENVNLVCIPNDTTFVDCFPAAAQEMSANEFQSGDAVCEGDSGSSAYEQRNFNSGTWVSYGVLSRGGSDADSGACIGGIYTRFDAWGPLLISAANEAATLGGYGPPGWATSTDAGAADANSFPVADGGGGASSSTDGGGSLTTADGGSCSQNPAGCTITGDAGSVTGSGGGSGSGSSSAAVGDGGGAQAQPGGQVTVKGCACGSVGSVQPEPAPWRSALAATGLLGVVLSRRRKRPA